MEKLARILISLLQGSWFRRISRTIYQLFAKRCFISPSVVVLGSGRFTIGRSITIGPRSKFVINGEVDLANNVWMSESVRLETDGVITVGAGTTLQRHCTINGNVVIGRECILAPNVFISSGTHPFRAHPELSIRSQERAISSGELAYGALDRQVIIEDDCWLGTNVVVTPGVRIGQGSVVGANAVVTRDVTPRTVVAGVPARQIGIR